MSIVRYRFDEKQKHGFGEYYAYLDKQIHQRKLMPENRSPPKGKLEAWIHDPEKTRKVIDDLLGDFKKKPVLILDTI